MFVPELRQTVRQALLDRGSSEQFKDAEIDRAALFVLDDFADATRVTRAAFDFALVQDDFEIDLTDATDGVPAFHPAYWVAGRIGTKPIKLEDFEELRRLRDGGAGTGRPTKIGFELASRAWLWPACDAAYTLTIVHQPPVVSWSPGSAAAGVELNIPDRWLRGALWYGVASVLVFGQSDKAWVDRGWGVYLQYRERCRGAAAMSHSATKPAECFRD